MFPYNFSQNGLVAYKNGELLESQTINNFFGEETIKRIVNWTMNYLSKVDIPIKVRVVCSDFSRIVMFLNRINFESFVLKQ